jgi:hypothetical protein
MKDTRWVEYPEWGDGGFVDPDANSFWVEMPGNLRGIAITEIERGNRVSQILRNDKRGIVLLEFERAPFSDLPNESEIVIHTRHQYGNYCYEGTKCTYEDSSSGCFLAFLDPNYEEEV